MATGATGSSSLAHTNAGGVSLVMVISEDMFEAVALFPSTTYHG